MKVKLLRRTRVLEPEGSHVASGLCLTQHMEDNVLLEPAEGGALEGLEGCGLM